ncbi:Sec-independent protein translocase protein TatB [Moraxella marmotae]|uniref:Sec-independent protein translocase protein TatB n=1 Tax=Moraxella marmotae TaxID=3344520 RepID=UPI0035F35308
MIGNLGFFELTLFGIIALVVLGPEKLPIAARTVGRWYGTFRRASQRLQNEISSELQLLETQEMLKKELEQIRQSEQQMKAQMDALQQSLNRSKQHIDHQTAATWQQINAAADHSSANNPAAVSGENTTAPMNNYWFLLGDYDRRRRLPKAPFLPNYTADPLLSQPQNHP